MTTSNVHSPAFELFFLPAAPGAPTYLPPTSPAPTPPAGAPALSLGLESIILIVAGNVDIDSAVSLSITRR